MAHKHTCLDCGSVIAQGDFDCEIDRDHDFARCDNCAARKITIVVKLSSDLEMLDLDNVIEAVQELFRGEYAGVTVRVSRQNVDETRIRAYDDNPDEYLAVEDEIKDRVGEIIGELWMKALQEQE